MQIVINDIGNAPVLHTEQVKACLGYAYDMLGNCADDYHSINDVIDLVGGQLRAEIEARFINRLWAK